ncbi:crotonase/enoyl-CoA hydratase family protein [Vibrio methylphosphonaticus]|uniref:crotonase/enoyl-CoA hydratase family protein n=1 Tax=Vibrio methylphosphonaticus TaxID=2946866 RepID=UPI00202A6E7D|nr:crotonase/enoyl-CoA hydratase family protein [Vibrio methylphosphonaticus]MCL9773128.1 crotonase/enoyl-CoA hydratase family protein [Vibrio methylphosphonaticus]
MKSESTHDYSHDYRYRHIEVTRRDDVMIIALNRPDKLNGVDMTMFDELIDISRRLKRDHQLRAVILSGNGGNFSSGLDFSAMMANKRFAARLLFKVWPGSANRAQQVSANWRSLSVPVIAVIEGYCWGAGLQIALGADFRICAPNANLSIMESKMGLTSDMAGSLGLREVMSKDQAMRISMCATQLDAAKSLELGLVTEVHDAPMQAAEALCQEIALKSPDVTAAIKHIYTRYWTEPAWKLLAYETYSQVRIMLGQNFKQAQKGLRNKTIARFKNRQKYW